MDEYTQCLNALNLKISLGVNRSLQRVIQVLALLDNPQDKFKSVHVAGTNGKGSSCAMLSEILKTCGYKVGLTVSPHITSVRERIQINGEMISQNDFVSLFWELEKARQDIPLTYFECLIVMAFLYFAQQKVAIAVVETGLGGRFDATNVLAPIVGGITNVTLEHQEFLGNTLPEILTEKMQIAKRGMHFWSDIEDEKLNSQLRDFCDGTGVSLNLVSSHSQMGCGQEISFDEQKFVAPLQGAHQKKNTAFTLGLCQSLREQGFLINNDQIRQALSQVSWPGRLEYMGQAPCVILDGAHNASGLHCLADYLHQTDVAGPLVFGCLNNRNLFELIKPLLPWVKNNIILVQFNDDKSYSYDALVGFAKEIDGWLKRKKRENIFSESERKIKVEVLNMNGQAWQDLKSRCFQSEYIVVCGSLYLVSEVRRYLTGGIE